MIEYGKYYEQYGIIGKSEKLNEIITIIKTVAPTNISILITGDSGTGKEIISELIHKLSKRENEKFIPINCGAIPEGLIENELFGHEKGSFTSATDKSKGYFESADKGTIFLDEIGELPLSSQVKLLRVLENGTFMRVGGSVNKKIDVRIVAATNKDLAKMVEKGEFREDLYFRLKAINLEIPPLRERLEDIPLFAMKFSETSSKKHNLPKISFDKGALSQLINSEWRGNIRELKNFVDMLAVMEAGHEINSSVLVKYLKSSGKNSRYNLPVLSNFSDENSAENGLIFRTLLDIKNDLNIIKETLFTSVDSLKNFKKTGSNQGLDSEVISSDVKHSYSMNRNHDHKNEENLSSAQFINPKLNPANEILSSNFYGGSEKEEIEVALKRSRGNRRKAAEELNISERTLYRKIVKYNIQEGGD